MAGKAFTNLNKIFLSDTFRAWFDKTNQIISTINPLEIYGVTAGVGEVAGITMEFNTDGTVTIGLDLPDALTGDFSFNTGVTFNNFISVAGLTVDFSANGGHGATLTGRVVRTINGATGDVALDFVAIPGNSADGDILYYENTGAGATFRSYNLFSDGTADNGMVHVGGSGGVFFGITAGGASSANEFVKLGNIQLVGTTASGIYMVDNSQTSLSTAKIAGADIRYGTEGSSQLLTIGGRNISGTKHSTNNLILDFNNQTTTVGGGVTGNGSLNIGDASNFGRPILYTDNGGETFALRYLLVNEKGGRTSGGSAGVAALGGNPSTKGLSDVGKRIRLEHDAASVEVEISGPGKTSGFVVYGQEESGHVYGDLLLPTLVARKDGNVVIGGIAPDDGGITGTTFGSLNVPSGKLYLGGKIGESATKGMQIITSNGVTAGWTSLSSTAFNYVGTISSLNDTTSSLGESPSVSENSSNTILFRDENRLEQTGPFTIQVNFPLVKLSGKQSRTYDAVLGVAINIDGTQKLMRETVLWKDLHAHGIDSISPTFVMAGQANKFVRITPFATLRLTTANGADERFSYVIPGTYTATFNKIG